MKYQSVSSIKYQVSNFRFFTFILLITCNLLLTTSFAQTATSSPYSRYGIGDIPGKGFGQGFAMGGTTIAIQNDSTPYYYINTGNPASYSNMRWTTAEVGLNYNHVLLQNASTQKTIHNASLAYVALAFPFYKKWWGASIGLVPFSSVGYKVSDHQEIPSVGGVDYLYEGSGGINQLYFGNGIKPFPRLAGKFLHSAKYARLNTSIRPDKTQKTCQEAYKDYMKSNRIMNSKRLLSDLSIGANASYLFGNFNNSRRSIFANNTYPLTSASNFNTLTGTTTRVSDLYFDYGLQMAYTIDSVKRKTRIEGTNQKDTCRPYKYRDLKENVKLLFGVNFAAQTNINAKMDTLSYNYFFNQVGGEVISDTTQFSQHARGKITLPLSFGFGIGFKKGDRLLVAADFAVQNWSSYQAFNQSQGLKNSMRVSLGAQYVPKSSSDKYFNRVNYRMGGRYMQTALDLKNTPLTEYAVSAGVGFPVGPFNKFFVGNFSMVNVGLELGQRGTITNGLIKEKFFKVTIGFTINDRWFVKPKID
jgi:hypothetical protein